MRFSIIIPVYNAAEYLEEAVRSLQQQDTSENYECILIDDGSTDASYQIMQNLATQDSRLKICHQTNQGPAAARNCGLSAAQGDYVLFMDADDQFDPQVLRKISALLNENSYDVVVFGYREISIIHEKPNVVRTAVAPAKITYTTRQEVQRASLSILEDRLLFASTCNKAYSRNFLHKHGLRLPTQIYLGEDLAFNCQVLSNAASYAFLPDVLYDYLHRDSHSIITRFKPDKFQQLMICHEIRSKTLYQADAPIAKLDALNQMDFIRICFSCFMDLFLKDCPMRYHDKRKFIRSIIKGHSVEIDDASSYLTKKEKLIYSIYRTQNCTILLWSSFLFYILKFSLKVNL